MSQSLHWVKYLNKRSYLQARVFNSHVLPAVLVHLEQGIFPRIHSRLAHIFLIWPIFVDIEELQENRTQKCMYLGKQTNKQANKQTNKQTNTFAMYVSHLTKIPRRVNKWKKIQLKTKKNQCAVKETGTKLPLRISHEPAEEQESLEKHPVLCNRNTEIWEKPNGFPASRRWVLNWSPLNTPPFSSTPVFRRSTQTNTPIPQLVSSL